MGDLLAITNTGAADKLLLVSGEVTTTIKTSQDVSAVDSSPQGISYNGQNTPWCGSADDKLYLTSGVFSSTLKTSIANSADLNATGISATSVLGLGNTLISGNANDKLWRLSGVFTMTVKSSLSIGAVDTGPQGICQDSTNVPWTGQGDDKLYLTSGDLTSTLKTSLSIGAVDLTPKGISWTGVNTPWAGQEAGKIYITSGQFTSTLKDSDIISASIEDVDTNLPYARLGIGTPVKWYHYSNR